MQNDYIGFSIFLQQNKYNLKEILILILHTSSFCITYRYLHIFTVFLLNYQMLLSAEHSPAHTYILIEVAIRK